jgi:hypothetical protein
MDYDIMLFSTQYITALVYVLIGSGILMIALPWSFSYPFRGLIKYLIISDIVVFIGAVILIIGSFAAFFVAAPASWLAKLPPAEKTEIGNVLNSTSHRHPILSIHEFSILNEDYVHRDELLDQARVRRCAKLKSYYFQSMALGDTPVVPKYCLKLFASRETYAAG